ncbi:MAG: sugar kinase [Vicinamibacterales bacterium]
MTERHEDRALDVVAVGELNPDLILSGIRARGPLLGVEQTMDRYHLTLGSSTAITAVLLRRLGLRVAMVARLGDDEYGRFCRQALQADGVNTDTVLVDAAHDTGLTVSLAYESDRLLLTCPGAMSRLSAHDVPSMLLQQARHLHSASFFLQLSLRDGLARLFADARRLGLSTSLDTGWDPDDRWLVDDLRAVLAETDILLPNQLELARLSGTDQIEKGAERLLDLGVGEVVVKLGDRGSAYFARGEHVVAEGRDIAVVDTTGAGDAFNAGYLTARLMGRPIDERLRFANACGALTAGAIGGTGGFSDKAMVDAFACSITPSRR